MSMSKAGDAKSRELIQTVSQISNGLMNEVSKVIIGKQENLRRVTIGILSNGNMLIEDYLADTPVFVRVSRRISQQMCLGRTEWLRCTWRWSCRRCGALLHVSEWRKREYART